jgi:phosphate-selective porin OprO/OprP
MVRFHPVDRPHAAEARQLRFWTFVVTLSIASVSASPVGAQTLAYPTVNGPALSASPGKAMFGMPQALEAGPAGTIVSSEAQTVPSAVPAAAPSSLILDGDKLEGPMPPTEPPNRRFALDVFWENGLRFESKDGQFHLHVGGSAQIDSTWLIGPQSVFALPDGGPNGEGNAAGTFLRRARLRADGDIFGLFDFLVEYDFARASNDDNLDQPSTFGNLTGTPGPTSVWMQIREVPVLGNVRVGYQTKPLGMTNNTSQSNLPFMERPDNADAFYAPFDAGNGLGISAQNWSDDERIAWRYGIYRPLTNVFAVAVNNYAIGARVTALPWYVEDGQGLVHLGLGYWSGDLIDNEFRLRARPLLRNGPGFAVPVLVDTGEIPASRQYTIGPEFAMVLGSLTIQAEWAGQCFTDAYANNQLQGTVFFQGGYVEALYFLTGEAQPYVKRDGVFGRVLPISDYSLKKGNSSGGIGAWQVGVRFSYLNLNDKAIQGGEVYDWTVGLNWFLNPNMKFQLNYIVEHRDGPTGTPVGWINGAGLRASYDF